MKTTTDQLPKHPPKIGQRCSTTARRLAFLTLTLALLNAHEIQAQYKLTQYRWGFPAGINNSGTIIVSGFGDVAVVNGDSYTPISIPNSAFPNLGGINAQGTIVGSAYTEDFSSSFAFVRSKQGEMTILAIQGTPSITPLGINARGVVVGSADREDGSHHGFIWDSNGPKLFDAPGADSTELSGINASGTAVGNYTIEGVSRVFTLAGSKFSPMDIPDALWSTASGINSAGQVVGYYQISAHPDVWRGFVYLRGAVTSVDYVLSEEDAPASFPPEPFDFGDGMSGTVTYIRSDTFTGVTGINDRGDIVGRAGAGYTPVVDCDGCGLTADDFFGLGILDTFIGERDGSRNVQVKKTGKHTAQKIRLSPGSTEKELQSIMRGGKP